MRVLKIIKFARQEALEAREQALSAGDEKLKSEWLDLARLWDRIGEQYAEIQKLRDQPL